MFTTDAIVIRTASTGDAAALRRLAALDSRPELEGPALLAEVGGVPRAALAVDDGAVAADPFVPTADLVALLRLRARRLDAACRTAGRTRRARLAAFGRRRGDRRRPAGARA